MKNAKTIFTVIEFAAVVIAAVLFFVSINGYSLLEYYQQSQLERNLAEFIIPGLATRKAFFWASVVIAAVSSIIKYLIKDTDSKDSDSK